MREHNYTRVSLLSARSFSVVSQSFASSDVGCVDQKGDPVQKGQDYLPLFSLIWLQRKKWSGAGRADAGGRIF